MRIWQGSVEPVFPAREDAGINEDRAVIRGTGTLRKEGCREEKPPRGEDRKAEWNTAGYRTFRRKARGE